MKKINSQQLFNLLTSAQTGPNLTCMCTTGTTDSWNVDTLMWGYLLGAQTQSPVDVVPADDKQHRRTICAAHACPLHDHMLHEQDHQFLNQVSIHCEQGVLNPQLSSVYHTNQFFSIQYTLLQLQHMFKVYSKEIN
jgi:hypothetical protein